MAKTPNVIWHTQAVIAKTRLTMRQRMVLATEYLRNKTTKNISIPVERTGGEVVRSKPGQFPRADTTLLMSSLVSGVNSRGDYIDGYVGTPQPYGVTLELELNRSFLVRTLREEQGAIVRILTAPIA